MSPQFHVSPAQHHTGAPQSPPHPSLSPYSTAHHRPFPDASATDAAHGSLPSITALGRLLPRGLEGLLLHVELWKELLVSTENVVALARDTAWVMPGLEAPKMLA